MHPAARVAALTGALLLALVSVAGADAAEPGGVGAASPSITVSPSTGLVDKQVVTVTGRGFRAGAELSIRQCETGAPVTRFVCNDNNRAGDGSSDQQGDGSKTVFADAGGAFSTEMRVRRAIATVHSLQFDCVAPSGACALVVVDRNDVANSPEQQLDFDASARPPRRPSLAVTPTDGLADGQLVTVAASRFRAGQVVLVLQCTTSSPIAISCAAPRGADADATGSVHLVFAVSRVLPSTIDGAAPPHDCAAGPEQCALFVTAEVDPVRTSSVPLEFDASAPPAPIGLSVSPRTELVDAQTVTISGQRTVGEYVVVVQCRTAPGPDGQRPCDTGTLVLTRADFDDGRVDIDFQVRGVIQLATGAFDCRSVVDVCALRVGVGLPPWAEDDVPISFAGAAPAPKATFTG